MSPHNKRYLPTDGYQPDARVPTLSAEDQIRMCALVARAIENRDETSADILKWLTVEIGLPEQRASSVFEALLERGASGGYRWESARNPFAYLRAIARRKGDGFDPAPRGSATVRREIPFSSFRDTDAEDGHPANGENRASGRDHISDRFVATGRKATNWNSRYDAAERRNLSDLLQDEAPRDPGRTCPGGSGCTCCSSTCDCGCSFTCAVWLDFWTNDLEHGWREFESDCEDELSIILREAIEASEASGSERAGSDVLSVLSAVFDLDEATTASLLSRHRRNYRLYLDSIAGSTYDATLLPVESRRPEDDDLVSQLADSGVNWGRVCGRAGLDPDSASILEMRSQGRSRAELEAHPPAGWTRMRISNAWRQLQRELGKPGMRNRLIQVLQRERKAGSR